MSGTLPDRKGQDASADALPSSIDGWLADLARAGAFGDLLGRPWQEQLRRGYGHTLREIAQQPITWLETIARLSEERPPLSDSLAGAEAVVFTGSGSSIYAAECVAPWLQEATGLPVSAVPAGLVLTHPEGCLPPAGRFVAVSLARSGDSPESRAVVDWLLDDRPQARHVLITCNGDGALATSYRDRPEARAVVLDPKTNDRSLVMTSSFTNLVLAARAVAPIGAPAHGETLARAAVELLREHAGALAGAARRAFSSVVYLGSGSRLGSARESALKMLEMNAGEVWTLAESFLGLRHGPMSAIRPDTLVVAFVSSDPHVRAYELDLLAELDRKHLGCSRVVVGASLPDLPAAADRLRIDCPKAASCDDGEMTLVDAVVGQLLAFFRCLSSGRRPDSPSADGVITRVVSGFRIHGRPGQRSRSSGGRA